MQAKHIVSGKDFFNLLYSDSEFTAQLGRTMLAASKFETELKLYLIANALSLKKRLTLGGLLVLLKNHNLLPKIHPHIEMFLKQRNYLTHNLYALLSGTIEETLLPSMNLVAMDVHLYTEKASQLESDLIGFADIVRKERLRITNARNG